MRWPILSVYTTRFPLVLAPLPHSLLWVWVGSGRGPHTITPQMPSSTTVHPPPPTHIPKPTNQHTRAHVLEQPRVGPRRVLPVAGRLHELEVLGEALADHLLQQLGVGPAAGTVTGGRGGGLVGGAGSLLGEHERVERLGVVLLGWGGVVGDVGGW